MDGTHQDQSIPGAVAAAETLGEAWAAYGAADYVTAFARFRVLAEQGLPNAQGMLGMMYAQGQGIPQDYEKALGWLGLAADAGDVNAEYNFGAMYELGLGMLRMPTEALKWFRRAADKNAAPAQFNIAVYYEMGICVPQDFLMAYMWYHLAASETGDDEVHAMAVRERRLMARKLTKAEIGRARRMASKWMAEHPKTGAAPGRMPTGGSGRGEGWVN